MVADGPTAVEEPKSKRVKASSWEDWGDYFGDLNSDGEPHSQGKFKWDGYYDACEAVYEGELKTGKRHGHGTMK